MMKYEPLNLKICALAALVAGFAGTVVAEERAVPDSTPDELYMAALNSITSDRDGVISGIVSVWEANTGYDQVWKEQFTDALNSATDAQLLNIQSADSFDDVRAILQGRETPVSLEGVSSPEALGDLSSDLVFTPVVPCRIFDTRSDSDPNHGHTSGPTPTTHSYQVYGSAATIVSQGGLGACSAPKGEPVGIHGNFTAVPFSGIGKGNIRVWPYGGTLPGVSLVNYEAGTNIANAASVSTCYYCSYDLNTTTQYFSSDQVGDVMGYYYPAQVWDLSQTRQGGYDLAIGYVAGTGHDYFTDGFSASVFVSAYSGSSTLSFNGGEEVMVSASGAISSSANVIVDGTYIACYSDGSGNLTHADSGYASESPFCEATNSNGLGGYVSVSGRFGYMPAGTYTFGICALTGGYTGCSNTSPHPGYSSKSTKINVFSFKN